MAVEIACADCGVTFIHARQAGARPQRCPACRATWHYNRHPERSCEVCGFAFRSSAARVRTCSKDCGYTWRHLLTMTQQQNRSQRRFMCMVWFLDCGQCGEKFTTRQPRRMYCSPACIRRAHQASQHRRRAMKRGARSERYSLSEIAVRDGFRCGICRRKVNMALTAPHRNSPSVDHVWPIFLGGDDTRANVQLAHLGCNVAKGARGSHQLALIG